MEELQDSQVAGVNGKSFFFFLYTYTETHHPAVVSQ